MHRSLPLWLLELKIEAHYHLRKQLIDLHQCDVLSHTGAGAFPERQHIIVHAVQRILVREPALGTKRVSIVAKDAAVSVRYVSVDVPANYFSGPL